VREGISEKHGNFGSIIRRKKEFTVVVSTSLDMITQTTGMK
jgi:hypothetical protein